MVSRRQLITGAGLAALAPAGCAAGKEEPRPGPRQGVLTGAVELGNFPLEKNQHCVEAAAACERIAWAILQDDEAARSDNYAMSPSSLGLTLAMVAEGATGRSAASLDKAFGMSGDQRSEAVATLRQALRSYEDLPDHLDENQPPPTPVVHQESRTVVIGSHEVEQKFLNRVGHYYAMRATRVELDAAKADLDAWVRKHTAGLIESSAVEPDADTRLVLQDALLFGASWRTAFLKEDVPLRFEAAGGRHQDVEALGGTFQIPYVDLERAAAGRLPYDDNLAMDLIVPSRGVHPLDLTPDELAAAHRGLTSKHQEVRVTMPPSETRSALDLLRSLQDQGISLAELSGIIEDGSADSMMQQVVLMVSAKGTVGAAVTEMVEAVSAPAQQDPPKRKELRADRPFLMRVLDVRTGLSLFLAVINDADKAGTA